MKYEIICDQCDGYGLEKRDPIKCPCDYSFCYKCENREGFIIKPWEECRKCFGLGRIIVEPSDVSKIKIKPSDVSKIRVEPSDVSKIKVEPSDVSKININFKDKK